MTKTRMMVWAVVAACSTLVALRAEVTWTVDGTGVTASGSGTYVLEEPVSLTTLDLQPTVGQSLRIEGAALNFSGEGQAINYSGEAAEIAAPVNATGTLTIENTGVKADLTYEGALTKTHQKVFENVNLADYSVVQGIAHGQNFLDGTVCKPYHVVRGDGVMTVQLQAFEGWLKCVKIELRQSGADVTAKIVYAKYHLQDPSLEGIDFDEPGIGIGYTVAESLNANGYGIRDLSLVAGVVGDNPIVFSGAVRTGSMAIGQTANVTFDGGEVLGEAGVVTQNMDIRGQVAVTNVATLVFSNVLSGARGRMKLGGLMRTMGDELGEVRITTALTSTKTKVLENAYVESLTNLYVNLFGGDAINPVPGTVYHLKRNGTTLTGQAQLVDGGWLKCVYITLEQSGNDILAYCGSSAYYSATSTGEGVDFDELENVSGAPEKNQKHTYNWAVYQVREYTLWFDTSMEVDNSDAVKVTWAGTNNMTQAVIEQRRGTATVTTLTGLPCGNVNSSYTVFDGDLTLQAPGSAIGKGVGNGYCAMVVTNGTFKTGKPNQLLINRGQVTIDDATFFVGGNSDSDSDNYVNHLTLQNGACVTGQAVRISYGAKGEWKVTGTTPSEVVPKIRIAVPSASVGNGLTLDVDDVTGDDGVDVTLKGAVEEFDANTHHYGVFTKKGPGTARLLARVKMSYPMVLDGGTLFMDGSDLLKDQQVDLKSGTLKFQEGVAQTLGAIDLQGDAEIALGTGTALVISNSTEKAWSTETGRLNFTGKFVAHTARFVGGLTEEQRRKVRINGLPIGVDGDGYIHPTGMAITFR